MSFASIALLRWYLESGVDDVVGEAPVNHYSAPLLRKKTAPQRHASPQNAENTPTYGKLSKNFSHTKICSIIQESTALAAQCTTLESLRATVTEFQGCALRTSASNTVFSDGTPEAPLMVIGEAPGVEEDSKGIPFVGPSGHLLNKMLESIGLERHRDCYITNVVPWRPLGNRKPTPWEVSILLPFLARHITLASPRILLLVGGLAASLVRPRNEGIMKLRGQWLEYSAGLSRPIPAIATFHPAYLLRSPAQKRFAWHDLLALKSRLSQLSGVAI